MSNISGEFLRREFKSSIILCVDSAPSLSCSTSANCCSVNFNLINLCLLLVLAPVTVTEDLEEEEEASVCRLSMSLSDSEAEEDNLCDSFGLFFGDTAGEEEEDLFGDTATLLSSFSVTLTEAAEPSFLNTNLKISNNINYKL